MGILFLLFLMFVILRLGIAFIKSQIERNAGYVFGYAASAAGYFLLKKTEAGANLAKVPILGKVMDLIDWYFPRASHLVVNVSDRVSAACAHFSESIFGTGTTLADLVYIFMEMVPACVIAGILGYLILFPPAWLFAIRSATNTFDQIGTGD